MSKEELKIYQETLNKGLEESYEKLLRDKVRLEQNIVTSDENGKPVILSAKEALRQYQSTLSSNSTC